MDQAQSLEPNNQASDNQIHSNICDNDDIQKNGSQTRRAWSLKEDNQLKQAIKIYSTNWLLVAQALPNRNPSQCAQRWKRIKPYNVQKPWTSKEDQLLLRLVQVHNKNWVQIAKCIPNRTSKQVRERFVNKLNPEINKEPFTKEEDMIIVEGYKNYGSKWCKISKLLQGRPENIIKNRYYSYIRKRYFNIENPYYVVPQQNNEIQQSIQKDNLNHQQSKTFKRTTIGKLKIRKRLSRSSNNGSTRNKEKKQNNIIDKQLDQLDQENVKLQTAIIQENNKLNIHFNFSQQQEQEQIQQSKQKQAIKEELSNQQSQIKQEVEFDQVNKLDQLQESLNISQSCYAPYPLIYNTPQTYKMMYYYPQQLPMQFIHQYFINGPYIQYGVQSQETLLSRSQEIQQSSQKLL
ncbi:unnamed protein product (macronuclear) [Paramecium tetraurelia]|uniref:Myb-like DNA-binding domain protein n=1 Tax=Paramecium tetraurelia TaxID=5888 RepID=A0BII0_PARTE|nr:uncharacterized protein GSPATT00004719001 [Paramecium tetraurelia]CAK58347.1 unnamed protein product [Paramecium tetraurelia]|eukprot:XP_001425745.1 hypothetical protein (macronuclear) [Paramecium tetraurelia strain d4-2]